MSLLYSNQAILNAEKLLSLTVEKRINGQVSTEAIFDNGQKIELREEKERVIHEQSHGQA